MNSTVLNRTIPGRLGFDPAETPRSDQHGAVAHFFFQTQNGAVTFVSSSIESALGWRRRDWIGMTFHQLFHEQFPLNADHNTFDVQPDIGGSTLQMLRSIRNRLGSIRILSMQSAVLPKPLPKLTSESEPRSAESTYHFACDVTDGVNRYRRLSRRLRELANCAKKMSDQENEVCQLALTGLSHLRISEQIGVSERTVDRRRASLMRHFNASNANELIANLVEFETLKESVLLYSDAPWRTAHNSHALDLNDA